MLYCIVLQYTGIYTFSLHIVFFEDMILLFKVCFDCTKNVALDPVNHLLMTLICFTIPKLGIAALLLII